jgi:hypothetical protein
LEPDVFISERVMGMEWDGGEFQHGCEAIRGKDTERGGVVGEEAPTTRASEQALR